MKTQTHTARKAHPCGVVNFLDWNLVFDLFVICIKFSVVSVFASHFTAIPHASMKMCFGIGSKSLCDKCVYAFLYFDFYVRSTLPLFSFSFRFFSVSIHV